MHDHKMHHSPVCLHALYFGVFSCPMATIGNCQERTGRPAIQLVQLISRLFLLGVLVLHVARIKRRHSTGRHREKISTKLDLGIMALILTGFVVGTLVSGDTASLTAC